jgi:arginase family enzyme
VGFHISYAEDIEEVGYEGIVKHIRGVVGDNPVYLTLDIDVLDPSFAPAYVASAIGIDFVANSDASDRTGTYVRSMFIPARDKC